MLDIAPFALMLCNVGYVLVSVQRLYLQSELHIDDKVLCTRSPNKKGIVLATDAGKVLIPLTGGTSDARLLTPLEALNRLVAKEGVGADGRIVTLGTDSCLLLLNIYFPKRLWNSGINLWRKSQAAAVLFSRLHRVETPVDVAIAKHHSRASECSSQDSFSLRACFGDLPHHAADLKLPMLQSICSRDYGSGLADLPTEVLLKIVVQLAIPSVAALACTCRFFKAVTDNAVPGLLLSLYPHQRAAVRWMLQREAVQGPNTDPCWRKFISMEGLPFWGSAVTGEFTTDQPRPLQPCKGGFFCDEPGLGKTITGLAVVLKTRGTVPVAPEGAPVSLVTDSKGKPAAFYMLPAQHSEKPRNAARSLRLSLSSPDRLVAGTAKGQHSITRGSRVSADSLAIAQPSAQRRSSTAGAGNAPKQLAVSPVVTDSAKTVMQRRSEPAANLAAPETLLRLAEGACSPQVHTDASGGEGVPGSAVAAVTASEQDCGRPPEALDDVCCARQGQGPPPLAAAGGTRSPAAPHSSLRPSSRMRTPRRKSSFTPVKLAARSSSAPKRSVSFAFAEPEDSGPPSLEEQGQAAPGEGVSVASGATEPSKVASASQSCSTGVHLGSTAEVSRMKAEAAAEPEVKAKGSAVPAEMQAHASAVSLAGQGSTQPKMLPSESAQDVPASSAQGSASQNQDEARLTPEVCKGTAVASHIAAEVGAQPVVSQTGKRGRQKGGGEETSASGANKAKRRKNDAPASGMQGGAGEPEEEDDPDVYVQCDLCSKWRILPKGHDVEEHKFWMCTMHPEPRMRLCSTPEEVHYQKEFTNCSGFVAAGKQPGAQANMQHFRLLGAKFQDAFMDRHSVLWWLAKQSPETIASDGFRVPRNHLDDSAPVLIALGLQPVPPQKSRQSKSPRQPGSSGQPGSTGGKARAQRSTWRQPWYLSNLRLDTAALQQVLSAGLLEADVRRIFLSPATLLIIPAPLIQHWLHQVQLHTRPGSLRVLVLASDGSKREAKMPPAHQLAWDYDLVITTFSRLSSGWAASERRSDSPLLQVHWLRIVLDEGHMLGASLSLTNKLQMACALRAERRWVMTGTPTPSTPTSDLAHLQPLLAFLHHQPYGTERRIWEEAVQKPFESRQPEGRRRLMDLLSSTMIRAAKIDLITIPPLFSKVVALDFAPEHARSYNELVEVIWRNLLLADWFDEDHMESLLATGQGKWAMQMLRNIKMSCCVAGNCNLQVKDPDVQETLELLSERHHWPEVSSEYPYVPDSHPAAHIRNAMYDGCDCQKCGATTRLILVTPCAHLLCSGCISPNRERCTLPGCGQEYVMQSVNDPARKETNPNPKWAVPTEVIEWQASYTQQGASGLSGGRWNPNWQVTKSSKCVHLLKRLYEIGAAEDPLGSTPKSQVRRNAGGGILREDGAGLTKAIVFSQFWQHILLVGSHLRAHHVSLAVLKRDLSPAEKAHTLDKFQNDDECGVLLMDEAGAVGLDLSFASYVFLMEPIEDSSLQQQVVSRAHRMGATKAVHVEILVMKGTAEEELVTLAAQEEAASMQQASAASGPSAMPDSPRREKDKTEAERRSKRNRLLLALRRIREASLPDYHDLPLVANPEEPYAHMDDDTALFA